MDKEELNQIYYLSKEIEMWRKALNRLQSMSLIPSQEITGMPFGTGKSDKVGNLAVSEVDIKDKIEELQKKAIEQQGKLIGYIQTIDDSLMRQIMYHRHVLCMKWNEVAMVVGGGNTADGIRMMHNRFLEEK
jgi:hypothetical protein